MIHVKNAVQSIFRELDISSFDSQDGKDFSESLIDTLIENDSMSGEYITTKLTELNNLFKKGKKVGFKHLYAPK